MLSSRLSKPHAPSTRFELPGDRPEGVPGPWCWHNWRTRGTGPAQLSDSRWIEPFT
jgi:hypothetical protein